MKTTGASGDSLENPPATKDWFSKKVTAKGMLRAAKTIIDSWIDVLGDILPKWIKGLLNTLKEVFDFAIERETHLGNEDNKMIDSRVVRIFLS